MVFGVNSKQYYAFSTTSHFGQQQIFSTVLHKIKPTALEFWYYISLTVSLSLHSSVVSLHK